MSECLKKHTGWTLRKGLRRQDLVVIFTLDLLLIQPMMVSYVLYVIYLIAHDFLTL